MWHLELPSGRISGFEYGSGRPTLLIHGIPEIPMFWESTISSLPGRKWILPWLPGLGPSQLKADFSLLKAADLISEFIGSFDEPVDLIGFDWGGALAWFIANNEALKNQIKQIVVIGAPQPKRFVELAAIDQEQARRASYMSYFQRVDLREKLVGTDFKALTAGLPKAFVKANIGLIAQAKTAWAEESYSLGLRNYYGSLLEEKEIWSSVFSEVRSDDRVTWLWPENDEFFISENIKGELPIVPRQIILMNGTTHFAHLRDPRTIASALEQVLV